MHCWKSYSTVVFLLASLSKTTRGESTCRYLYLKEPPSSLMCNPYTTNELRLSCRIRAEYVAESRTLEIRWFYIPFDGRLATLTRSSIFTFDQPARITSNTIFSNIIPGMYFCAPRLLSGDEGVTLLNSIQTNLQPPDAYTHLDPCEDGFVFQSVPTMRCAQHNPTTTTQGIINATDYANMTKTITVDMGELGLPATNTPGPGAPSQSIPQPTPTQDHTQPTASGNHNQTDHINQPTSTGDHNQTVSPSPTPVIVEPPLLLNLQIWVLVAVSIALFVVVGSLVGIVCLCCVVRKRRYKKPKVQSKQGKSAIIQHSTSSVPLVLSRNTPPVESPPSQSPDPNQVEPGRVSHLYSTLRWNRHSNTAQSSSADNRHIYTEPGVPIAGSTPSYCYPRGSYFMGEGESIGTILKDEDVRGARYSDRQNWSTQGSRQYEIPYVLQHRPRSYEIPQKDGSSKAERSENEKMENASVGAYKPPDVRVRDTTLQIPPPRNVYQGLNTETIDYVSLYST